MPKTNRSKNVLIVEDDKTYIRFWRRMLHELGCKNCAAVQSSEAAAEFLKKQPVDLLISDVMLPSMNGYELAKTARQKNPQLAIILTTAYQTDLSRFDLKGLQCHLLHKPYQKIGDVAILLKHLLMGGNIFGEMEEDSFSKNRDYPEITEWTL